ncbi:MAG: Fructose-1,6-bisphosphatase/inositol-1-monophosphatase [Verrucomicrobia subdivision 3 bacterium]|nr:Fructose-1,6-bisphosphatase/inositol-1-monophosphatase [Limisphaerales bacterium]MCS1416371.1 Fructose-1,6-bisphosphatase/inositol-1-monophosphatase [Limisphaerales bacterium]
MNRKKIKLALQSAEAAAQKAGAVMSRNLHSNKRANFVSQHDIKLELDVRCQRLIERHLRNSHPDIAVLGEEGESGQIAGRYRWVVDPIDGTVNFAYGIPHACVSIALQARCEPSARGDRVRCFGNYETIVGAVFDPFMDEMWVASKGGPALLNGKKIQVSRRARLAECILAIGFSKTKSSMDSMLPSFNRLVHQVRKMRIMGAAALSLSWIAGGRMDAFVESGVRLWDVAAGGLILERAGGEFYCRPIEGYQRFRMIANNGLVRRKIQRYLQG